AGGRRGVLWGGGATGGSPSSLSVGSHTVTADYSGTASYAASSGALSGGQTVAQADTTKTITSVDPAPSTVGQSYTVTATVTADAPGSGTPTGTVSVNDGDGN